jgi:hypothetical protein
MMSVIGAYAGVSLQAWTSPPTRNSDQQREAIARRKAGEELTAIARTFGMSNTASTRL